MLKPYISERMPPKRSRRRLSFNFNLFKRYLRHSLTQQNNPIAHQLGFGGLGKSQLKEKLDDGQRSLII